MLRVRFGPTQPITSRFIATRASYAGTLALLLLVVTLACPAGASAHAELVRAEPPVDSTIIAPPGELHLYFTEEVATSDPAPSVRVLDENGNEQVVTVVPNGRELTVTVPSLSPGVWTVSWSVKSVTDGHILSGTYAFRIGGGIPAGAATTSGETPALWAVVARWLTFLGAAIAAAGFLFGLVIGKDTQGKTAAPRSRLIAILAGALAGLLATFAEPVLLSLTSRGDDKIDIATAFRSLPNGWWIRPPALALAILCALVSLYTLRRRIPDWLAIAGGLFSLGSLLGLSFTSHAAGRESWRELAVATDIVHQWSVALWVGGLLHLALWWPNRHPDQPPAPLRRFSFLAVFLFAAGVITGIVNAGLIFPNIDTLWNSDYGYVLIAKIVVLLVPFALAIRHRRLIGHAVKSVTALPSRFHTTLRIEIVAALVVLLGGSALALSAPPLAQSTGPEDTVLMQFVNDAQGHPVAMAHLRIDPARQGSNAITFWLTDILGKALPNDPPARISLDFLSLNHQTANNGTNLEPVDLAASRYAASGLDLSLDGWWQITANIDRDGQDTATVPFYVLLPDPNVHGFSAPPAPEDDPAARAVFEQGVTAMNGMDRFRWTESINTGADTMVVAETAQSRETATAPMTYELQLTYSGSFTTRADGSAPPPPVQNSYHSVTIGDQAWLIQQDGTWLEQSPSNYGPISGWGDIYHLADQFQLGPTTEIDGETVQIITLHTPPETGQTEAWFAWWVGTESGKVYQLAMVARAHYMVWHYSDFNGDWQVPQPPGGTG